VYGDGAAFTIESRQQYRFTGTGLREYEDVAAPRVDEFDRWASDRDRAYDTSPSARYVSQDVVGYQDLDANGTWRVDASYGNVWTPSRVDAGWAPYRDGHWTWVDPWGWTWVDDAPWGFAVSHYGRWNNFGGTWGWVPGPVRARAYYAPALVAFVGGNDFQLAISGGSIGGVAWFALGPRDVYRPSYQVSRGYFENVNRSNTVINTTVINNYYNNTNVTNVVYANRQIPGAVVAVPTTTFVQSQPVSRAAVRASKEMIAAGPVGFVPPVAPTVNSVRGAAAKGGDPPPRAFERPVVARSAPPAVRADFATQQPQLTAKPGKPLDDAARRELKPAATAPAPVVNVIAQEQKSPPIMRPPPAPIAAKPTEARGRSDERPPAMTAPLPQRSAQSVTVPPPRVAPTVAPPSLPQRANSESARPVKQNEPRTSVAEGKPKPAQAQPAPPAQAQPASTAEPRNQGRKPAAAKSGDRKDADDDQKREQDDRKPAPRSTKAK
jgi:hypothetical protein